MIKTDCAMSEVPRSLSVVTDIHRPAGGVPSHHALICPRSGSPWQTVAASCRAAKPNPDRQQSLKMSETALQYEIDQLKLVSARLDSLANQHPISESAILSVSGHVLTNAILLEVLLATRIKSGDETPGLRQSQS
jgi:hypothetical protein